MEVMGEWSKWGGGVLKQIFVHQCCSTVTGNEKHGGQALPPVTLSPTLVRVKETIPDVRHMHPDVRQGEVMRAVFL